MKTTRVACLIACCLLAGQVSAQTLNLKAVPTSPATSIKLAKPFEDIVLAENAPVSGVTVQVPPDDSGQSSAVFAVWSDGAQTSFPLILSSAFADKVIEVRLSKLDDSDVEISAKSVYDHCLSRKPRSVSDAFDIFHWCKTAATIAEGKDQKWDKNQRGALQGWLVANYYLFTRSVPISPYDLDQDLITRMDEIRDKESEKKYGSNYWLPLQLADVTLISSAARTKPIRFSGIVPDLIRQGKLDLAKELNDKALDSFSGAGVQSVYGVDIKVLNGNRDYINTLQSQ